MNENLNNIWAEVQEMFKLELTELTYNTWISRLSPVSIQDNQLTITAPNTFTKRMIEQKYKMNIVKYLQYILEEPYEVIILDPASNEYFEIQQDNNMENGGLNGKDPLMYHDEEDIDEEDPHDHGAMVSKKYTFDNFIKGKSNDFAMAAAVAVSGSPGTLYNPLFIYGGAGLGKTHLMKACVQRVNERFPDKKVVYLSSETFTNELIQSLNNRKNREFRNKYRNIDVLLIDDIQFIAGKTGTQEEFFHTFNDLYGANKQIIISSDRPPKEIKTLEDRLVSRFEWGLIADIQPPDFETRVAILKNKMMMEQVEVPMEVLEYIAMNIKHNIRELEGALLKVIAYSTLMKNNTIDLEFAKKVLQKLIQEKESKVITVDLIKREVCSYYNITLEEMDSKSRAKSIAEPRQIAMYITRVLTDLSLLKIAGSFNRDHSTIIHGIEKIESTLKKDPSHREDVDRLIEKIKD